MRNYQQKSFDEIFGRVLGRTTMTTTTNQKVYIDKVFNVHEFRTNASTWKRNYVYLFREH